MATLNPTAVSYAGQFANQTLPIIAFGDAMKALRKKMGLVKFTRNKDFAGANATLGAQIPISYVGRIGVDDITAASVPDNATALANNTKFLLLDKWKRSKPFAITDQEMSIFQLNGIVPRALERAVQAVAEQIESDAMALAFHFPAYAGVGASSGVFASNINTLGTLHQKMSENLFPAGEEKGLFITSADVGNLIILDDYKKNPQAVGFAQGQEQYTDALLGKILGYNIFENQFISTRTPGTYASTAVMASAAAIGATSISITTSGAWAMKKGDVLKLVSSTSVTGYQYVSVLADVTISSTTGTVTLTQPLEFAVGNGSAVVAEFASATYAAYENLCVSPDAIAIGNRILVTGDLAESTGNVAHVTDDGENGTGLTFTLKKFPGSYQGQWEVSVFYGLQVADTRLGGRLLSGGTLIGS